MRFMRTIGRFLQILGLLLLPASMVVQLMGGITPGQLLLALVFGGAAFYLGRMLEGYASGQTATKDRPPKK